MVVEMSQRWISGSAGLANVTRGIHQKTSLVGGSTVPPPRPHNRPPMDGTTAPIHGLGTLSSSCRTRNSFHQLPKWRSAHTSPISLRHLTIAHVDPGRLNDSPAIAMITSTAANMASIAIECTLFGTFILLSSLSLVLLVQRRAVASNLSAQINNVNAGSARRGSPWASVIVFTREMAKSPLIVANILLMLTVTAHWVLGIQRLFIGVVYREGGQAAVDFYNDLGDKTEVARIAILFLDMLIGDAIITYRTWLVWRRNHWVIIFPIITISALIVCGIGLLHEFGAASPSKSVFITAIGRWVIGFCGASLCTNLYGTIMIAYRIWATNKLMKKNLLLTGGRDLTSALAIFVESAAMYSAWTIIFVVLYATRSTLQTIGSGCGPTVIGIAFMLITVRVGLGWGQDSRAVTSEGGIALRSGCSRNQLPIVENSFPMRTFRVNVDVTQTVERDTNVDYPTPEGRVKPLETAMIHPLEKRRW
ncbi:hypothetical protein C8Q80DRAFT_1200135 [Daedaleopsis nitida]|nr:hypothetical protein C8Q80DRAFT_1200135 [Daedaleopsis nitida]